MTEQTGEPGRPERRGEPTDRWAWMVQVADLLAQATEGDLAELASLLEEMSPREVPDFVTSLQEMQRGEGEIVRGNPNQAPGKRMTIDEYLAMLDEEDAAGRVPVVSVPPGLQFMGDLEIAKQDAVFREEFGRLTAEIRLVEQRRRALVGWARLLAERETGSPVRPATEAEAGALRESDWDDSLDAAGVTQEDVDAVPAEDLAYWAGYNAARRERSVFWDELDRDLEDPEFREEFIRVAEQIARVDEDRNAEADRSVPVDDPTPDVVAFLRPLFDDLLAEYGTPTRMLNALSRLVYGRHGRVRWTYRQPTVRKTRRLWTHQRPFTTLWEAMDPEPKKPTHLSPRLLAARRFRAATRVFNEMAAAGVEVRSTGRTAAYLRAWDAVAEADAAEHQALHHGSDAEWGDALSEYFAAKDRFAEAGIALLPSELGEVLRPWWHDLVDSPNSRVAALLRDIGTVYGIPGTPPPDERADGP